MATGMLQRPGMFGSTLLNGRRPAVSLPLGGSRKSAPSYTVCSANKQESEPLHVAKMATAALAASLLLSAALPEDALAARSGGRVGGSSFRSSAPRAAPRAAPSPRSSGPSVRNNNYYSAPPLVSPFGGYGYGGGGISMFPSFGVPLFYGGGIFNFLIFMFVASAVLGVVRNLAGRGRSNDDEFDD